MINKVILAGRIANEPVLNKFSNDFAVTTFNIAVDRGYKRDSEKQNVDFLYCKAFNKTARNIHAYCKVGSGVCITGQIHNNKFEKDGKVQYMTEIMIENIKFLPSFGKIQTGDMLPKTPDEIWQEMSDNEKTHLMMLKKESYLREYVKKQSQNITEKHDTQEHKEVIAKATEAKWQQDLNQSLLKDNESLSKESNNIEVTTDSETATSENKETNEIAEDIKHEAAQIVDELNHKANDSEEEITTELPF